MESTTTRRNENRATEEERGLEPHTLGEGCALLSKQAWLPASFSPEKWSVRESNPLRRAFQTPALPFELTDPVTPLARCAPLRLVARRGHVRAAERKAEDSNPTRTMAARIAFQTISAPGGFAFRVRVSIRSSSHGVRNERGQDGRIRTCGLQSPRLALLPG